MINRLHAELAQTRFDFRAFACPHDPLGHLFQEWVPYYRLKFAIARALQPSSILEIGVRFGYSAATFLSAAPSARLLGIDLNNDTFGGQTGALDWARRITAGRDAQFLVADSQTMERFPGGIYDFIHVDGQQDGIGTFHDLRRAVAQGRWVLLDGYFWTRENFFNANDFLLKFKDVLQYALALPGYAGELLLRVSDEYLAAMNGEAAPAEGSEALSKFYDSAYYLNDCGGCEKFRETRGHSIADQRLLVMLALTRLAPSGPALDLGCGRGEMTWQLAKAGRAVTAVDYSASALALAQSCFAGGPAAVRARVQFVCGDASRLQTETKFAVALAGDLIEHLAEEELERLYAMIAAQLQPEGVFILHTAPNEWNYVREHRRRRRAVEQLGGWYPHEPRTRYELLMHINEQSPARLRRALRRHFAHVEVWLGTAAEPAGSLARSFSLRELSGANDIYAVASQRPITRSEISSLLQAQPLPPGEQARCALRVVDGPETAGCREQFSLEMEIENHSQCSLASLPPAPVFVSYHWFAGEEETPAIFEGRRSELPFGLPAGEKMHVTARVDAPPAPGVYRLLVTLVQEGFAWFESTPGFTPAECRMTITPRGGAKDGRLSG